MAGNSRVSTDAAGTAGGDLCNRQPWAASEDGQHGRESWLQGQLPRLGTLAFVRLSSLRSDPWDIERPLIDLGEMPHLAIVLVKAPGAH
jgi:hypothetical protein